MAPSTVRFVIRTRDGGTCQLFSAIEKANGDLIIPVSGGDMSLNDWDKGAVVNETRYSIHQSLRSPTYTTIKLTSTSDQKTTTLVALTDAVKNKSGFTLVFVRRCQNPEIPFLNPINPRPIDRIIALPELEADKFTLFHGVFVGHRDTPFLASDDAVNIAKFKFNQFQIIVMISLGMFPSYHTTELLSAVTTPPEPHASIENVLRFLMTGRAPAICIRQYKAAVNALSKNFLEDMRRQITAESTREYLDREIENLGSSSLGSIKLDTRSQPLHLLSDVRGRAAALPHLRQLAQILKEAHES